MFFFNKQQKINNLFIYNLLNSNAYQQAKHDYDNVFLKNRRELTGLLPIPLRDASILVLGCGYNYPDVVLFSDISRYAVGLDIIDTYYRDGVIQLFRDLRNRGISSIKALVGAYYLTYKYYRYYHYLKKVSGVSIKHQKYRLQSYDGCQIPFKKETFDVVLSNAVLEHVDNLERLFQEMYRVIKKQGVCYHLWHNYYSFSGGHVPEPLCLKHPWGHLYGKYETCGLNKLTPDEIQNHFSRYFNLIALCQVDENNRKKGCDSDFQFEREELLTDDIRNELRAFPLELLLTRAYLIIGRKK